MDAGKSSLSEATRGSVLHWFVGALRPTSPASGPQQWTSRGVSPEPSHDLHHFRSGKGMADGRAFQETEFLLHAFSKIP